MNDILSNLISAGIKVQNAQLEYAELEDKNYGKAIAVRFTWKPSLWLQITKGFTNEEFEYRVSLLTPFVLQIGKNCEISTEESRYLSTTINCTK